MRQRHLPCLDGVLHDLGALQQGQCVADGDNRTVVDDGYLVFTPAQRQMPAHLLGAPQRRF
ncbi:hypothetical protein D3C71_2093710 [compost metagenome]